MLQNNTSVHAFFSKDSFHAEHTAKTFPLIALPLLIGVAVGACVGLFSSSTNGVTSVIALFQGTAAEHLLFPTLLRSLRFVLAALLLGFTLYGVILLPPLSFLRGFLLGCSVAAVFQAESLRGLLLALFSIGVPALLTVPAFLLAAMDALGVSALLLRFFFRRQQGMTEPGHIVLSHAALLALLCAVEAVYSCYLVPALLRAFS